MLVWANGLWAEGRRNVKRDGGCTTNRFGYSQSQRRKGQAGLAVSISSRLDDELRPVIVPQVYWLADIVLSSYHTLFLFHRHSSVPMSQSRVKCI